MFEGTLSNGFEFSIDEGVFDDMEVIDALTDMEDNDPTGISRMLNLMLGKEQKKELYAHIKRDHKRVSQTEIAGIITELFTLYGEKGKN